MARNNYKRNNYPQKKEPTQQEKFEIMLNNFLKKSNESKREIKSRNDRRIRNFRYIPGGNNKNKEDSRKMK